MPVNSGGSSGSLGRFIKLVNGRPVLRVSALLSSASGAFLYAYWRGWVAVLETVGMGITGALDGLASFLYGRDGLISGLFGIPEAALEAAWTANAAFITSTFGPLSPVAITAEFAFIFWVFLELGPTGLRYIKGAFV